MLWRSELWILWDVTRRRLFGHNRVGGKNISVRIWQWTVQWFWRVISSDSDIFDLIHDVFNHEQRSRKIIKIISWQFSNYLRSTELISFNKCKNYNVNSPRSKWFWGAISSDPHISDLIHEFFNYEQRSRKIIKESVAIFKPLFMK